MSTEQSGWPEQDGKLTQALAGVGAEPDGDIRPALGAALARSTLLDVLDEFCASCLIGDCGSCDGGRYECDHGEDDL